MNKLILIFYIIVFFMFPVNVLAQGSSGDYSRIGSVPENCPEDFVVDFSCQRAKLVDSTVDCFENKCPDAPSYEEQQNGSEENSLLNSLDVFGARFNIDSGQEIAAVINILISTFLGIVSLYALIRGVYVAGFKIAGNTEQEKLTEARNEIVQLVLAFVIAWSAIFVLQFVFSLLGLGSINNYILFGDNQQGTQIVIN
ncbi:MAG: hypothetical protein KatS3mg086_164 [Candidatus Dojkabacteria bacterium]|nr:MAG: hypothetical protein KatS3mg086_164 [Candidatus Dojkabacteria bacterium]